MANKVLYSIIHSIYIFMKFVLLMMVNHGAVNFIKLNLSRRA